jgi:probable HAF family extracellular repeat protein
MVADLGPLPAGAARDFGEGVNSAGDVAGYTSTAAPASEAFGWTAGGGFDQFGTLGGTSSFGLSINDEGVVVGRSDLGVGNQTRPFRVLPGGTMENLGTLGGNFGSANDVNASGVITGSASTASTSRAFIWQEGVGMTDIGNFTPTGLSSGQAINAAGHVAGQGTTSRGELHAFWWDGATMTDLGTLEMGTSSLALGMNDADAVVGLSTTDALGTSFHAFLWSNGAGMVQLDELAPFDTRAFDINNGGDAVGWSWIDAVGNARAVLWEDGGAATDLNDCIPAGSGWLLNDARGINDAGQIVGNGELNGAPRAFLLTPVPEPLSGILAGIAAGAIIRRRGRTR